MSLQSSNQDSSLEDEKAKNPFGDNPDEEEIGDVLSKSRNVHHHS